MYSDIINVLIWITERSNVEKEHYPPAKGVLQLNTADAQTKIQPYLRE